MRSHLFCKPRLVFLFAALAAIPLNAQDKWGYAWADQPNTASYAPNPKYARNSAKQSIGIQKLDQLGKGVYEVRFAGLGASSLPLPGGTVQVKATTPGRVCQVESWTAGTPDLLARVRCFTANGSAENTAFMVLVVRSKISVDRQGYALVDKPSLASSNANPAYSYSSAGGVIPVTRNSMGSYEVRFPGLGVGANKGNVQVTSIGAKSRVCTLVGWGFANAAVVIRVQCSQMGNPTDTPFTVLFEAGNAVAGLHQQAYTWGNQPTNAMYMPLADYSNGNIIIKHSSTGSYTVLFQGLGTNAQLWGHAQVTAQGGKGEFCNVGEFAGFAGDNAQDLVAELKCYTAAGVLANMKYTVLIEQ